MLSRTRCMASHELRLCTVQLASILVQGCKSKSFIVDCSKTYLQPMVKFSQLIFRGESRLEQNFKKICKTDVKLFFYFIFSLFSRNLSYRFLFYFVWKLNQSQFLIPEILRRGHPGRFWEKRHLTYQCPVSPWVLVLGHLF